MAALWATGFVLHVQPYAVMSGFSSEQAMRISMFTSAMMVLAYGLLVQTPLAWLGYPYRTGVLVLCPIVYHIALSIQSSDHWTHESMLYRDGDNRLKVNYKNVRWQLFALASHLVTLGVGMVLDVESFRSVGGTFFTLYILGKVSEIPWQRVGWPWAILILSGVGWYVSRQLSTWYA
jgi:hypothetical protein